MMSAHDLIKAVESDPTAKLRSLLRQFEADRKEAPASLNRALAIYRRAATLRAKGDRT